MSSRARNATSLLALAVIGVIAAMLVSGATSSAAAPRPCGGATDATYLDTELAVAQRISAGERDGAEVRHALHTVEGDRILVAAVAAGDVTAVQRELLVLLYNHEHIVRLRVSRAGHVLADVGGPLVLEPVGGSLRLGGRVVGTFTISLQDDLGYRLLVERLVGAHVVIAYRGATVMRDIAVDAGALPERGRVHAGGASYLVASFAIARFPSGRLRFSLLVRAPHPAAATQTCAQLRAAALTDVATRAYAQALSGPDVEPAESALARASALRAQLGARDDAAVARSVRELFASGRFAALRILSGGHLVAAAGRSSQLIVPLHRTLIGAGGRDVGEVEFTVQSAHGYSALVHFLTGAPVLVRAGASRLGGTFAGPAQLPRSGSISYAGAGYYVTSFAGERFPSGSLRIYLLTPAQ
jgi:hypothetical protein